MKDVWNNYSLKDGKVALSYKREYSSKSPKKTLTMKPMITNDAWIANLRMKDESIREKDVGEAHQQGFQGIQEPAEGRPAVEESDNQTKGKIMKKSEKKHEAKESKAFEKKEDKKESKSKKK